MTASWNLNKTSINLPYSYESLVGLLSCISKNESIFSQYDFAQWCDNFTMVFDETELSPIVEIAVIIARDIESKCDLFLVNVKVHIIEQHILKKTENLSCVRKIDKIEITVIREEK